MSDFRADLALGRSLEPAYITSSQNDTMILWLMIQKKVYKSRALQIVHLTLFWQFSVDSYPSYWG